MRQLRYQDLRPSDGPHGKIAWPAATYKSGKSWLTPITPEMRASYPRLYVIGQGSAQPPCSLPRVT